MTNRKPHIVGVGNALVDVLASVGHDTIDRHALTPGGMHLFDAAAASALFEEVAPGVRQSGGSVANSMSHAAELGCSATYLGKVARDPLGQAFAQEMIAQGIFLPVRPSPVSTTGMATGRCVVLVTPDGERTMSTYLGAALALSPEDIAAAYPAQSDVLLVEGYLWDAPMGAEVIAEAADRARASGARIALTPSDAGCVERNRPAMHAFLTDHTHIFIANRAESEALAGPDGEGAALDWASRQVEVSAVTDSERGAYLAEGKRRWHVDAVPVPKVVDSTGAGDAFAAGFLRGLVEFGNTYEAGRLGASQAVKVLGHFGARNGAVSAVLA